MANDDYSSNQPVARYFPVAPAKFVVLSLLTFGIYDIYWFYKNWHYVRERDDSSIWPVWRALFGPLWCYFLIRDVRTNHAEKSESLIAFGALLAIAYLLLIATRGLPDPFWVSSFLAFVVLFPIVLAIKRVNGPTATYQRNSRFRVRHFVLVPIATPLFVLAAAPPFNLTPHSTIVDGSRVPSWHVDWML